MTSESENANLSELHEALAQWDATPDDEELEKEAALRMAAAIRAIPPTEQILCDYTELRQAVDWIYTRAVQMNVTELRDMAHDALRKAPHRAATPAAAEPEPELRPFDDWCDEHGAVLWTYWPIVEPPWCGTPLDSDWPFEPDVGEEPAEAEDWSRLFWMPLPAVFRGGTR